MRQIELLVVGGGPAGLSASRAAAKHGASVLCLERGPRVPLTGHTPYLSTHLLPRSPLPLPTSLNEWKIQGARLSALGNSALLRGKPWTGVVVSHRKLSELMISGAEKAGAQIHWQTTISALTLSANGVLAKTNNGETITARRAVIAEGVSGAIAQQIGPLQKEPLAHTVVGGPYRISADMAAYHQVRYLGPQVPGAYGYLFPANDHGATAGAGGHISPSKAELAWSYFKNRESILRPQKINTFTVPLPYYSRVKHWVFGNTIFAGDIAGQVIKPGIEGILPGIICGSIAGELAGSGNLSEIEYRERVYEQIPELEYSEQLCRALESCLTVKGERQALLVLGLLSELVKIDELNKMKNATIEELNAQLSSVFS